MRQWVVLTNEVNVMGFKAINQEGGAIYSFNLNQIQWANLKSGHGKKLKMNCCDTVAIPKTSKYGVQFFAHHSNSCGESESVEHQFIKYICLVEMKNNGWHVDAEVTIKNGGDVFRSDVYAINGNEKLAIEVQWSPITSDELTRRNDKYVRAGIKCIWLCKNSPFLRDKNIAVFDIGKDRENEMLITPYGISTDAETKDLRIRMPDFINRVCGGGLKHTLQFESYFFKHTGKKVYCAKCHHFSYIPRNISIYCDFKDQFVFIDRLNYAKSYFDGLHELPKTNYRGNSAMYHCINCKSPLYEQTINKGVDYEGDTLTKIEKDEKLNISNRWLLY